MDVVDRLINRNMLAISLGKKPDHALDEAVDEIKRLRAEVEALRPLAASAQKAAEQITAMTAELHEQRDENERLRGLIKTYRNMLRYDWIAQQDKKIKELSAEIDALRGEGE